MHMHVQVGVGRDAPLDAPRGGEWRRRALAFGRARSHHRTHQSCSRSSGARFRLARPLLGVP